MVGVEESGGQMKHLAVFLTLFFITNFWTNEANAQYRKCTSGERFYVDEVCEYKPGPPPHYACHQGNPPVWYVCCKKDGTVLETKSYDEAKKLCWSIGVDDGFDALQGN